MKKFIDDLKNTYRPGFSLPAEFYQSEQLYRHELDSIFFRSWIYAGHVSEVPDGGCYFLTEIANESVIIVRDKQQDIRAFANVCRHRGSRICSKPKGRVKTLVCPYHAWAYELDGKLRSRREMPESFETSEYGLKPVRMEVFHGMIFITFSESAPSLNTCLAEVSPCFDIYGLAQTKVAKQETFTVNANWKLALENFMECYHCAPAHVEYSKFHTLKSPKDAEAFHPAMIKRAIELDYDTRSIDDQSEHGLSESVQHFYNRKALYDPFVSGSKDGGPAAPLLGSVKEYGGGVADFQIGPLTYGILYPDHAVIYRFLPTDLQVTDMEIVWLVNENAEEDKDYDLDNLTWLWTVTTEADKEIILNNQQGVNSRYYEPGPFSKMEDYTQSCLEWYLREL
jgi:phenylpropionate dioxygenase-like ring-hydroxylating dioxygenase large terminal subunit